MLYGNENGLKYVEGLDYDPGLYLKSDPISELSDYYVPHHQLTIDQERCCYGVKVMPFCPVWNVVRKMPAKYAIFDGEQRVFIKLNNHRSNQE